ncbi:hypothetical protein I3F58_00840 [Streptomyces sp. MUM 203J]|uniref:hypothetical protein n=1 Tax=Streptomyces sp. MUM 203J TaxID=2791990 RepID=UPI001F04C7D7|nr:hypothetical protein [Streptomyces sp. MUM 203J]MCH0538131.1 hypothetical protein [Streptomyces sp. MUM 203J]
MLSNDVRTLLQAAVPTAAVGAIAAAVAAVFAGGQGAMGAVVAVLVTTFFMGLSLLVLLRTAKSLPHLFQAMGLVLYTTQILVLFVFLATFKNTTLFHPRAFAISLIATTLTWVTAQTIGHMKAKVLYVEPDTSKPDAAKGAEPRTAGLAREK